MVRAAVWESDAGVCTGGGGTGVRNNRYDSNCNLIAGKSGPGGRAILSRPAYSPNCGGLGVTVQISARSER